MTVSCASIQGTRLDASRFGAKGDGVTDDTAAVQRALNALEVSTINHLHFPAGTYRLTSSTANSDTHTSSNTRLKLGTADMAGRGLTITGDGATLHSDGNSTRTHILVVLGKFKSLAIIGLNFSKNSTPLSATAGEPNGADALAVVRYDTRTVDGVDVRGCTFTNCHGALFTYNGVGKDIVGLLTNLRFAGNTVNNPYGANTVDSDDSYGGGQQLYWSPWVSNQVVEGNTLIGASTDLSDAATCPGGKCKDGSLFGGVTLTYRNNNVLRMGVESAFQINQTNYLGVTTASFVVPAADNSTTASVTVDTSLSTYSVGMPITFYSGGGAYVVTAWNAGTRTVTFKNQGASGNPSPGGTVTSGKVVYEAGQTSQLATFTGNTFDCTIPTGAWASTEPIGIAINDKAIVSGNTISNVVIGVLCYPEVHTPTSPQSSDSTVSGNTITTVDPTTVSSIVRGIYTAADSIAISSNTVTIPKGIHCGAISINADDCLVSGNTMAATTFSANGYGSANRALGIAIYTGTTGTVADGNSTTRFDVGVGSETAGEPVDAAVTNHTATACVVGVDPATIP